MLQIYRVFSNFRYSFSGLDPAEVLFSSSGPEERLDYSQAKLVDVVHTSGGFLGFKKRLGHRDFYPNGGAWPQPGCKIDYACNITLN